MNASYINTITQGDCIQILPQLASGSVNFVLTDPPYITNYKSRDGRKIANDNNDAWLKPAFAELYRVLAQDSFCVSFYGWPHADKFLWAFRAAGFRVVGHLTFPKRYTSSTGFRANRIGRGRSEAAAGAERGQARRAGQSLSCRQRHRPRLT